MTPHMREKFPLVPISAFCETGSGGTPSRSKESVYFGGSIPWVKSGELRENIITCTEESLTDQGLSESSAKLLPPQTLLVALYGATVGRIGILGVEAATNQAICHIIPDQSKADRNYLFYALQQQVPLWLRKRVGGGQPNISQGVIRGTLIPLPSLKEQQRIAAILDKADTIRRKRASQTTSIDKLLESAFMKMVGPQARSYSSWKPQRIESLAVSRSGSMRTGPFGSDLKHSEFVEEGIAVLGIDNAVQNRFAWSERRFITPEKYERLQRYRVYPSDVIITIMGTTGRSAVVPEDIPLAITTKHLASITLDRGLAEPEFVSNAIHRHPEALRQIRSANRGAIMDGLNLGLIKSIELRVPPIDVQQDFARAVHQIRRVESRFLDGLTEADALFATLVNRAFRGDLS